MNSNPNLADFHELLFVECSEADWLAVAHEAYPDMTEEQLDDLYAQFQREKRNRMKIMLVH